MWFIDFVRTATFQAFSRMTEDHLREKGTFWPAASIHAVSMLPS